VIKDIKTEKLVMFKPKPSIAYRVHTFGRFDTDRKLWIVFWYESNVCKLHLNGGTYRDKLEIYDWIGCIQYKWLFILLEFRVLTEMSNEVCT